MMLTKSKLLTTALALISLAALPGCASQAPRVSNAALGYAVTSYSISADSDEQDLSGALGSALHDVGIVTAMPAKAEVTIDFVRYSSPIIGLFYGGQHYTSLAVTLTDNTGAKIESFPVYIAANGDRANADADMATKAAEIIAANAANAFMVIKLQPKAIAMPAVKASLEPAVLTPEIEVVAPPSDNTSLCVIGADGQCVVQ
jgi:hypothetical protein